MIACNGLTRRFGDFTAVDNASFVVPKGGICAFLGPNGAGKSTTLKLLTGLLEPTSGTVTVAGSIGVLPETLGLFDDLTVEEHLLLSADVYGIPSNESKERITQLLRVLQLESGRDRFAAQCSQGMRKKTSFAMALLHNPQVLFLDEPFEAIDPVTAKLMFDVLVKAASKGVTIFLTSHILTLVERLADQVILIRGGKIVLNKPAKEMERSLEETYFEMVEQPVTEELEWLGSGRS